MTDKKKLPKAYIKKLSDEARKMLDEMEATVKRALEQANDEIVTEEQLNKFGISLAWECDQCGTIVEYDQCCTKCGYTWEQKCARWP